jgi:cysteine synthase A
LAHELSTGLEIWQDTAGKVDIVVVGMGTGGSISGIAKALKNKNPNIQIIGVEPEESPLLTKGYIGAHKLQGIGMSAGFIPPILAQDLIDEVVVANHSEAIAMLRLLAQKEGVFVGVSSGAILHAALQVAERAENQGKTIVVPMMDGAYRYLSEDIFA